MAGCASEPSRQAAQGSRTEYLRPQIDAPDLPLPPARLELTRPMAQQRSAAPVFEPARHPSRDSGRIIMPLTGLVSTVCGPGFLACWLVTTVAAYRALSEPEIPGPNAPPGESETVIQPMLASSRLGACLRDAMLAAADGRMVAEDRPRGRRPVVHLSIGAVGFDSAAANGERMPRGYVSLRINVEASLQQGSTHRSLGRWRYAGTGRPHDEWGADNGALARAEVDHAIAALRDQLLLDLYGVQPANGDPSQADCGSAIPVPDETLPERPAMTVPRVVASSRPPAGTMMQEPGPPGSEPSCVAIAGGDPKALVAAALARASGSGGWRQDRVRAYGWYLVAVRRGHTPAEHETSLLRAGLSEQDLLAAGQAAEAWRGGCEIGVS